MVSFPTFHKAENANTEVNRLSDHSHEWVDTVIEINFFRPATLTAGRDRDLH